ncbi:MAG: (d)CMP kinase, partial [Alphaproteobacteria bacterium]
DGRDIGTVICPQAEVKVYVDADVAIRARRRWNELRDRGEKAIYAAVLQEMKERDARDATRDVSPMAPAQDACRVDTTDLDADAAFAVVLRIALSRLGRGDPGPEPAQA